MMISYSSISILTEPIRRHKYLGLFLLTLLWTGCSGTLKENTHDALDTLFKLRPASETGIDFNNQIQENGQRNIFNYEYLYNGGGVAIADLNNDDLPDLFFTGNMVDDQIYLNEGGLKFKNISDKAGLTGTEGWSNGVTFADINQDGWMDIYICRSGGYTDPKIRANLLYINNHDNTFTESAKKYGVDDQGYGSQSAFLDYDNDGDLDLFVMNHPIDFKRNLRDSIYEIGNTKFITRFTSDRLYENNGHGKFTDVSKKAGIENDGFGLGLCVSDLNLDGWPDIYVANDYTERDFMLINNGNGTFTDQILTATNHISNTSMGCDIADLNNDGLPDILVLDMTSSDHHRSKTMMKQMNSTKFNRMVDLGQHQQYMRNTLQLNNGDLDFSEISQLLGISKTDWSWSGIIADFDNDLKNDIFITNGILNDITDRDFQNSTNTLAKNNGGQVDLDLTQVMNMLKSTKLVNYIYKNEGELSFVNQSQKWGLSEASFSNGAAYADLDNDGDLDLITNNVNDLAFVYENTTKKSLLENNFRVSLQYLDGNIDAIGSQISYVSSGIRKWMYLSPTRGYLSSMNDQILITCGENTIELEVTWPNGEHQAFEVTASGNQVLHYDHSQSTPISVKKPDTLLFEAYSKIVHYHKENTADEYKSQILLPHELSKEGPCLSIADLNNDGLDDLLIGGATGQPTVLKIQQENGTFTSLNLINSDLYEDVASIFLDIDMDGDQDIYIVSGGATNNTDTVHLSDRLYINMGNLVFEEELIVGSNFNGSCVAMNDIDKDGDLDLFVGGGVKPGAYPYCESSHIFTNNSGTLVLNNQFLTTENIGLTKSACWADLNNNGQSELIVTGEWMAINVFHVYNNTLMNVSEQYNLNGTEGWWNKVIAEDIDKDGDLDLIAGNLGLNTKYKASTSKPFQVFAGDFDSNGRSDIVLASEDNGKIYPIRGKDCSTQQCQFIDSKYQSFSAYADAEVKDIYEIESKSTLHLKCHVLENSIFINEKGKFRRSALPQQLQTSCIQDFGQIDLNNDGLLDYVAIGNNYNMELETGQNDASRGWLMINKGDANFKVLPGNQIGLNLNANTRSILTANIDGRTSIIVGVNNDKLRSFFLK